MGSTDGSDMLSSAGGGCGTGRLHRASRLDQGTQRLLNCAIVIKKTPIN